MNRPINKIVLIDDSPEASRLFPRNTLLIKPYVDVGDFDDQALADMLPLLYALCHDGVEDFRDTFDDLGNYFSTCRTISTGSSTKFHITFL